MAGKNEKKKETFIASAFGEFRKNIGHGFKRSTKIWRSASDFVNNLTSGINEFLSENTWPVIITLAIIIFVGLLVFFISDWARGKVQGNAFQTGVGGLIGGALMGIIIAPIIAGIIYISAFLLNKLFMVISPVILFLPVILWTPIYALAQMIIVLAKLLLLIPLFFLFLISRGIQLYRRIFYTCPYRECYYRGLPNYECDSDKCGESNPKLWPNFYGLLWHDCVNCGKSLPTLDILGRNKLKMRCGGDDCDRPLEGKHGGRAPEKLVAIAGGPGSGKTCYLYMAIDEIINGNGKSGKQIRGEIDIKAQREEFGDGWEGLECGIELAKTTEVKKAFLLYAGVGRKKFQLYLYDAPGEEFESISGMTEKQYFPMLEGFILMVDPLSFEDVRKRSGELDYQPVPLQEVVSSILASFSGERTGENKFKMRVAVVISKADMDCVKEQIGENMSGDACRDAIESWGGGNAVRIIEHNFETVKYFACSPLGRAYDLKNKKPFRGYGILEPLDWVLSDGKRKED
ncbi:MAG: hypothetical protein K8T10_21920 [Candidatus Eremiobacteraeota bacterium]|nr:hypothetical protein [Candidatus Eremiobacteraeota bacterium]